MDVLVLTLPRGLDHEGQRAAVAACLAPEVVTRLCPHCGSVAHGRPQVSTGHVSLAYADGLALAATADVPVGVDVERGDQQEWTRVEALLKATGDGLRRDPATVEEIEAWTATLDLPAPYVGTVAVLGVGSARVSVRRGSAGAPSGTATG